MIKRERMFNKDLSIGGILGAITGLFTSVRYTNKNDHALKNAVKTGVFVSFGYIIGIFIENLFKKNRKNN
jgi:uncharacterized membrane protein